MHDGPRDPVLTPSAASTDTVYAVRIRSWLFGVINGMSSRSKHLRRHRHTDHPTGIPNGERHQLRCGLLRGEDDVTFVLPVLVVDHHDRLTGPMSAIARSTLSRRNLSLMGVLLPSQWEVGRSGKGVPHPSISIQNQSISHAARLAYRLQPRRWSRLPSRATSSSATGNQSLRADDRARSLPSRIQAVDVDLGSDCHASGTEANASLTSK